MERTSFASPIVDQTDGFARVAGATGLPIVAYNNTSRTGLTLDVPILEGLARISSIVALKECERDLAVVATKIRAVGDRIAILSGDDDLGFPTFLLRSPGGFTTANLITASHPGPLEDAMEIIGYPLGTARAPLRRAGEDNLRRAGVALKALVDLGSDLPAIRKRAGSLTLEKAASLLPH